MKLEGGVGWGGMITFLELAHMFDATHVIRETLTELATWPEK